MATGTKVPSHSGGGNQHERLFAKRDACISDLVAYRAVLLTQFRQESMHSETSALKRRHCFMDLTASGAACLKSSPENNFVELVVCDGLTALCGAMARQGFDCDGRFYLYDAWAAMRSDSLADSEKTSAGSYAYLNMENTKNNLSLTGFDGFVINKGCIPESFATSENSETLAWPHFDLNSALHTLAALDYYWQWMVLGISSCSMILHDWATKIVERKLKLEAMLVGCRYCICQLAKQ